MAMVIAAALVHQPAYALNEAEGYKVKAAFIYNFINFVEWPAEPNAGPNLLFYIIGSDPFGESLAMIKDRAVGGRKIIVKNVNCVKHLKNCDVLFIPGSQKGRLEQILDALKGAHVLTIGDTDGFAARGVIINMFLYEGKIRFEVNLEAARRAGLRIDSRLLKLARIVSSK